MLQQHEGIQLRARVDEPMLQLHEGMQLRARVDEPMLQLHDTTKISQWRVGEIWKCDILK